MAQKKPLKPAFDSAHGDPDGTKFPALAGLVAESSKKGHVLLGEPHEDGMAMRTYAFLAANPDMFRQVAQNGVKTLVLEFPHELQGKLNAYLDGKIDRPELRFSLFQDPDGHFDNSTWMSDGKAKEAFEDAFLQTIDNAHAAGIKITFSDTTSQKVLEPGLSESLTPETKAKTESLIKEIAAAWKPGKDHSMAALSSFTKDYVEHLPAEEQKKIIDMWDLSTKEKLHDRYDDAELYALLRKDTPADKKILYLGGVNHIRQMNIDFPPDHPFYGQRPKGFAERLREEEGLPVTTIGLWKDPEQQGKDATPSFARKEVDTDFSATFSTGTIDRNDPQPTAHPAPAPSPGLKTERDETRPPSPAASPPGFNG